MPATRPALLRLPFVGPYAADAVLLYAFEQALFPLDRGVQRTVRRAVLGNVESPPPDPYRDVELAAVTRNPPTLYTRGGSGRYIWGRYTFRGRGADQDCTKEGAPSVPLGAVAGHRDAALPGSPESSNPVVSLPRLPPLGECLSCPASMPANGTPETSMNSRAR